MTVTTRRERRQQQRRQEQRRATGGGGGRSGGINQLWIAAGVIAVLIALFVIARSAGVFDPPASSGVNPNDTQYDVAGQTIGTHQQDLGNEHVPSGQRVTYPSLPPTSGQHWPSPQAPAPWGIKTAVLPFEVTTHNLEHGGIVILYSSDLVSGDVEILRGLVRQLSASGFPKIVLEPWPDMPKDSKVILTAWNWILKLPAIDQAQVIKFTRAHHGSAGEAPEATIQ